MLDLRPGNVPAVTRAAYLREMFGDVEGALELMAQALDATPRERAGGSCLDPDPDGASPPAHRKGRRGGEAAGGGPGCLPGLPLRAGPARPRPAPPRDGMPRPRPCCDSATQRRRILRTSTTWRRPSCARVSRRRGQGSLRRVRAAGAPGDAGPRQCEPRARLLLRRPRASACRGPGRRAPRSRAPERCAHARRLRLGALPERSLR